RTPHELLEHECIRQRLNRARFFEWEFRIGAKDVTVDVRGRLVLDEMRAVLGAACQGSGLGLVFRQFAAAEIASGAVVPILDQFLPPIEPFHLYYANRAHTRNKLRAFSEFMQQRLIGRRKQRRYGSRRPRGLPASDDVASWL